MNDPLAELTALEMVAAEIIAIIVGAFVVLATGQLFLQLAKDFASGVRWRFRGYRSLHPVRVNKVPGRIVTLGPFATTFELQNGAGEEHYVTYSNSRLDWLEIVRIVPKIRPQQEEAS